MSSILAALQKSKQAKQQEQLELAQRVEYPEIGYYKYCNGVDGKDGYFIGKNQFISHLRSIGIGIEMIEELLSESVINREFFSYYFESIYNEAHKENKNIA